MEKIKRLRNSLNMSQQKLANIIGVSRSTIAMWEIGQSQPDNDMLSSIADYFGVSVDYLLGRDNAPAPKAKDTIVVPVLGYVTAGVPIETIEEIIDYEELDPKEFNPNYEYFGLKIKGDSMAPKIQDGDIVIVRKQPDIESGEIAIVCINGDSATCKQIKKHSDGISLLPFNSVYDIKFYNNKEIDELPVTILGKIVELRRKF